MKTRIFAKDECAPDAMTAKDFMKEQGIEDTSWMYGIRLNRGDGSDTFFKHNNQWYLLEESCGVYEELYKVNETFVIEDTLKTSKYIANHA